MEKFPGFTEEERVNEPDTRADMPLIGSFWAWRDGTSTDG